MQSRTKFIKKAPDRMTYFAISSTVKVRTHARPGKPANRRQATDLRRLWRGNEPCPHRAIYNREHLVGIGFSSVTAETLQSEAKSSSPPPRDSTSRLASLPGELRTQPACIRVFDI